MWISLCGVRRLVVRILMLKIHARYTEKRSRQASQNTIQFKQCTAEAFIFRNNGKYTLHLSGLSVSVIDSQRGCQETNLVLWSNKANTQKDGGSLFFSTHLAHSATKCGIGIASLFPMHVTYLSPNGRSEYFDHSSPKLLRYGTITRTSKYRMIR